MNPNVADWLLEHHRQSYRYQLEQRDKLYDRISFVSSSLTALAGAMVYVFTKYTGHPNVWFVRSFYILICLATASFLFGVGFLIIPILLQRYSSILSPRSLQQYVVDLTEHATDAEEMDVLTKTKQALLTRYCDAATANREINERRSRLLLFGTKGCLCSVIFLLLALIPFFLSKPTDDVVHAPLNILAPVNITQ